jgi:membrane protein DedA with SNARE-associated domain
LNVNDQLLAALSLYGLPVLFSVIFASSLGFPLPATFVMVVAGSFVELGDMNIWWVVVLGGMASIAGDQVAYAIGHWGGHPWRCVLLAGLAGLNCWIRLIM